MTNARALFFTLAVPLMIVSVPAGLSAQGTGRIVGRVLDGAHGTPIAGAQVSVAGTTLSTTTAMDGRYTLPAAPAGPVEIRVRRIGYGPKAVSGVAVPAGAAVEQDVTLTEEVLQLEAITVTASAERGSVTAAMDEVRKAPAIMNTLPAELMRRTPDGDAGQAVQRVAGVTVQDGKYVFVRGLGERYTTTSLNSARIPSPEPERKVVPLDLFPSSMLEAITTSKTFTPEQPGDFSGASVNLKTREFPLGRKFNFSTSVGFNDATTGKTILKAPVVGQEWLGFAGAERRLPATLAALPSLGGQSSTQLNNIIASFRNSWTSTQASGRPNTSFSTSIGGEDPVFGQRLGYLASLTYSMSEDARLDERRALAVADGAGGARPLNEYRGSTGASGVLWGGLLNASTRVGATTKLSMNNAYTRSADNQASRFAGITEDYGPLDVTRLTFTERVVRSSQLVGEHLIAGRHTLDWTMTGSGVRRYEPDRSDLVYSTQVDTSTGASQPVAWFGQSRSATRTFSDLHEDAWDGAANLKVALASSNSTLKFGALARKVDRNADTRAWDILGLTLTDADRAQPAEVVLGSANALAGRLFLNPSSVGGQYTAAERLVAGYAQLDFAFLTRFRLVGGARVERAELTVNTRDAQGVPTRAALNNTDVLPALALSIQLAPRHSVRFSASQTLSRPEYRELSEVTYADIFGGLLVSGNHTLKRALIQNFDARWEWYPGSNEGISVALFGKHFSRPIEKILVGSTGAATASFVNAQGARNYGVEMEIRKSLGSFAAPLEPVSVFANTTVMRSRIETGTGTESSLTNPNRAMVGQAGYVVNAGLAYAGRSGRLNATLLYNVVGRRIVEAGVLPRPDAYEEGRNVVDASLEVPFVAGGQLKLDAKNLLDEPYLTTQGAVVRNQYRTGRTFSLGLSWRL